MAVNESVELTQTMLDNLTAAARAAQANAYCPYSNFPVGAAVLTSAGAIFCGCNVENGSYGLTICAERNAIAAAVAAGHVNVTAIVIVSTASSVARPCGACRQVIGEFSTSIRPTTVVSISATGQTVTETIDNLLPERFNLL